MGIATNVTQSSFSFEWLSWVIAIVLGLAAVLSPVITTYLNNHHQIRLKRLKDFEDKKVLAIQRYSDAACSVIKDKNSETISEYFNALANLYLYVPKEKCVSVEHITSCIIFSEDSNCKFDKSHFVLTVDFYNNILDLTSSLGMENVHTYETELLTLPERISNKLHRR